MTKSTTNQDAEQIELLKEINEKKYEKNQRERERYSEGPLYSKEKKQVAHLQVANE